MFSSETIRLTGALTQTDATGRGHSSRGSDSDAYASRAFTAFLVAQVVCWTVYAIVAQSSSAMHHDMTEAWTWGKEFQLGYHKHPPFFAWVTAVWFHIFPRQDWCFYLLSAVNSAIGLLGVWMLAGRFLTGPTRLAAVLLLALTPFHNFLSVNFNANSILLSVWPWTAYFFVRSLETRRLIDGALFGILAAIAVMCKYFSLLLLAPCFVASLLHPKARRYYASTAPYVTLLAFAVVIAPHAVWAIKSDIPTFIYLANKPHLPRSVLLQKTAMTALTSLAFHTLALLALIVTFRGEAFGLLARGYRGLLNGGHRWIAVTALGPFVLTLLSGTVGNVKVSGNFVIPVFFLLPIGVLAAACAEVTIAQLGVLLRFGWGLMITALLASPLIAFTLFASHNDLTKEPSRELAIEATRLWRVAYRKPLRIVAASEAYGLGMAFYSPDTPSEFTQLRFDFAPWITLERLGREGILIACLETDYDCKEVARAISTDMTQRTTLRLSRSYLWLEAPPMTFEITMIPPGSVLPPFRPMAYRN